MILSTNSQPAKSPLGRKQPSFQLVFSKKKTKKTKKGELTHQLINLTQYSLVERFKIKKPNLVVNWIHNRKIQNYKSPISSLTEFRIERKKTKKNPVSCSSKILGISGYPSFKNFYMLAEKPYPLRDGTSRAARSRGKLWALSITFVHYLHTKISTVDNISPRINNDLGYQLQIGWNWNHLGWTIVLIPEAVNQRSTIGQAAKKKCKERELLKLAYWNINRPK